MQGDKNYLIYYLPNVVSIKSRKIFWRIMRNTNLEILEEELVYDGKFITVTNRHFRNNATGGEGIWECVKRKTFGRIVGIAAITADDRLILTKNYRIPLRSWVIELCAGIMDKQGEEEESLAMRELTEETGYKVSSVIRLFSGPINSGLVEDNMVIYLGLNAVKVTEPELETGEDIEVVTVPLIEAHDFLSNPPAGVMVDMKIFSVIHHPKIREILAKHSTTSV